MQAIIPVAGKGTRLRPLTWSTPKVLIRLAGKTMLGHIIDELAVAGVDHVTLIVGYLGDEIVKWARETYRDLRIDFAVQERMDGLASAINLASPMADDGPALVVLGDTLFSADISKAVSTERNMIAVQKVDDPERFGVVLTENGRVTGLVEKPKSFVSDMAIVGVYGFRSGLELMDATSRLLRSGKRTRGEFQLTDAMQMMLDDGVPYGVFDIEGWFDCGKPETLLETNRTLLDMGRGEAGASVEQSLIVPPVSISPGSSIRGSVVGPYVSIASGCSIQGSIIRDSVIGCGTALKDAMLSRSLVGDDVVLTGRVSSLVVGSTCEIDI